jgi:hypothetical protein
LNTASQLEPPRLFIDRDAWSNALGAALQVRGVPFIAHKQLFPEDSPDGDWIQRVSDEGWIGITRDQNIRRKPNEIRLIRASKAMICVFTSGNLTAAVTGTILVTALSRLYERWRSPDRPVLYSLYRDGTVTRFSLGE